jgi:CheY-like chemotaxis protein
MATASACVTTVPYGEHLQGAYTASSTLPEGHAMDLSDSEATEREPCGSVLHIEDDPLNRELVSTLLSTFPEVTLRQAHNGRDGIEAALRQLPDVILLDMNMPDIGGLEVVRALSERIADGACQVILLTAEHFTIHVVKAMSLGASEYWMKPLTLERLRADLRRVLAGRHAAQPDRSQH